MGRGTQAGTRLAGFPLCKASIPKKAREEELPHQPCLHVLGNPG